MTTNLSFCPLFHYQFIHRNAIHIFPTCVGVNRGTEGCKLTRNDIPHMRGGEPGSVIVLGRMGEFSPHAWG